MGKRASKQSPAEIGNLNKPIGELRRHRTRETIASAPPVARTVLLHASDDFVARLTSYPAGFVQHMHDHDAPLYSQILAGNLIESVQGGECEIRSGQFAI